MRFFKILVLLISLQRALSVCYDEEDCVHKNVTDGILKLAVNLLKEFTVNVSKDDNLIFSPCNLELSLATVDLAAYGDTHVKIEDVMHIDRYFSEHHKHYTLSKVQDEIQDTHEKITVKLANGVFIHENETLNPQYHSDLAWYYDAVMQTLNFENQEQAKETINEYVYNETNGLIPELFTSVLPNDTKLCLVNVLYFKAPWEHPFSPELTKKDNFTTGSGNLTSVEMIEATNVIPYLQYSIGHNCSKQMQIISIPYKGEQIFMYIILLQEGYHIKDLINDIEPEDICDIINGTEPTNVFYQIPRFEYKWIKRIDKPLQALGMKKAFTNHAELDMLENCDGLWIDRIVHGAKIKTAENGTGAAAATEVVLIPKSIPEFFRANRPFLHLIFDKEHGVILFTGLVNKPSSEENEYK